MKQSLIICDMKYVKLCDLVNEGEYSARRIQESFKINEITQLTFEVPLENPNIPYIINENLVLFNGEYYRIKIPSILHNEDGSSILSVSCAHLSETLQTNVIVMAEITPKTVIDLMKIALVYEDGTPSLGWSIGKIGVNLTTMRGLEASEQSSFSNLCTIAEKYDGMLLFNSQTRTIDLMPVNDTAKPDFELSIYKNLKEINISYDTSSMVTRLYCFGGNDKNGNEINIMSVNPTGKAYIENFDYFYNLGYTHQDILVRPELFIKTNVWRDSNYYLPSDLYTDGIKELEKVAKPKVEVTVQALDLSRFPEYRTVPLSIGEAINVRDEDLGISFICNIIGRTIDYDSPHILNIELTNQIDYKNLLSDLFTKVSTASQVITTGGVVKGTAVDGINTSQVRDLDAKYASIDYLEAKYIDADSIAADYIKALEFETEYLNVINADIENLKVDKADIDDLTVINADIENLKADKADINDLKAINADIENLRVGKLEASDLTAINADIVNLKADKLDAKDLYAIDADIKNLKADKANITDLNAINANIEDLTANKANVTDLNAAKGSIDILESDIASIGTLIAGGATVGGLQAIHITSKNTVFENAVIKDAMIDKVSVSKLSAGNISTNNINIQSDDGRMIIADNTIQISDDTKVRVQLGKDASNDYSFSIWDKNGKLLFDARGITESAIQSSIIRNDMISETANIDAAKIDISSLFEVINNDGTHTLNGSKIKLDTDNQTLDIVFNSMTTKVDNIESQKMYRFEVISTNGNVFKNGIGSTILKAKVYSWDEDITDTIPVSKFQWHRVTANSTSDSNWDREYGKGKKEITVTRDDISGRASFSFDVDLP